MNNLTEIVERIKKDDSLKKQFAKAVKENKVVEFCKSLGVEVSKEEIEAFLKVKKGELTDEELNKVSGGCETSASDVACNVLLHSVASVGLVCAAGSINQAIHDTEHCVGDNDVTNTPK